LIEKILGFNLVSTKIGIVDKRLESWNLGELYLDTYIKAYFLGEKNDL
tara:strand:- start:390 stop:533 length:144 start_codon:yes stop_codon:yes gene_type:complete